MEVEQLTATLAIDNLMGFVAGMKQADTSVETLRASLRGLAVDAKAAQAAMSDIGVPASALARQAALNSELRTTRDLLAEIRALSGFSGRGGAAGGVGQVRATSRRRTSRRRGTGFLARCSVRRQRRTWRTSDSASQA